MELNDVMRTTFAAREFTGDPLPDDVLYRILDNARFAPSGGNRQGQKVIVVRDPERKKQLGKMCWPAMRVAAAQTRAGEVYWQTINPTSVDFDEAGADEDLPIAIPMFRELDKVPVVLIVAVDLSQVASIDQRLDRIGVVSGGSVYPFCHNILLGARNEGFGGALTTLISSAEPEVQELLGLETHEAVCAMLTLGRPPKQLTKLSRKPVEEFAFNERADGDPLTG